MNNLRIEATKYTLEANFDAEQGVLELTGSSYPENAMEYFTVLYDWIGNYLKVVNKPVVLSLKVNYLNTSSIKCILDLFEILEQYYRKNGNVLITWYYEKGDEDILELGQEMAEDVEIPFEFISV